MLDSPSIVRDLFTANRPVYVPSGTSRVQVAGVASMAACRSAWMGAPKVATVSGWKPLVGSASASAPPDSQMSTVLGPLPEM